MFDPMEKSIALIFPGKEKQFNIQKPTQHQPSSSQNKSHSVEEVSTSIQHGREFNIKKELYPPLFRIGLRDEN